MSGTASVIIAARSCSEVIIVGDGSISAWVIGWRLVIGINDLRLVSGFSDCSTETTKAVGGSITSGSSTASSVTTSSTTSSVSSSGDSGINDSGAATSWVRRFTGGRGASRFGVSSVAAGKVGTAIGAASVATSSGACSAATSDVVTTIGAANQRTTPDGCWRYIVVCDDSTSWPATSVSACSVINSSASSTASRSTVASRSNNRPRCSTPLRRTTPRRSCSAVIAPASTKRFASVSSPSPWAKYTDPDSR